MAFEYEKVKDIINTIYERISDLGFVNNINNINNIGARVSNLWFVDKHNTTLGISNYCLDFILLVVVHSTDEPKLEIMIMNREYNQIKFDELGYKNGVQLFALEKLFEHLDQIYKNPSIIKLNSHEKMK